jgi:hypothetical protein
MNVLDLTKSLCYYDIRNPESVGDLDVIAAHELGIRSGRIASCMCDNCFYGRTELAETAIHLNLLLKLKG